MWSTRSWRPLVGMRCICRMRANPFWTVQKRLFDIYGSCSPAAFKVIESASVKVCFEQTSFFQTNVVEMSKTISAFFIFIAALDSSFAGDHFRNEKKLRTDQKKLFFRRRWIKQPSVFGGRGPFPESRRKSRKSQFISFFVKIPKKLAGIILMKRKISWKLQQFYC